MKPHALPVRSSSERFNIHRSYVSFCLNVVWLTVKLVVCLTIAFSGISSAQIIIAPQSIPLPCVPPPAGLVAWWPMNDASGSTIIKELVGNSHAGPMMSPLGAAQAPQPTAGKVGGAINFVKFPGSGLTGAVVSTTMSAALANVGATDLSIDAWINFPPTSAPARRHYIINKIDAPNKRGYALYIVRPMGASASYLEFQWGDGIAIHTVTSSAPLAPNQWHFVAATFARSGGTANIRLYVNGAQQGAQTTAASGSLANNISLMIGYQPSSVDEPIAIDELEIFNRALSPAQVQSIYNAGSHGKCLFKVINPNPNTNPN